MKKVSEKEFVKFVRSYKGGVEASLNMCADPPIMVYRSKETGEVIARCLEISLGDGRYTYKDAYFEVDDSC